MYIYIYIIYASIRFWSLIRLEGRSVFTGSAWRNRKGDLWTLHWCRELPRRGCHHQPGEITAVAARYLCWLMILGRQILDITILDRYIIYAISRYSYSNYGIWNITIYIWVDNNDLNQRPSPIHDGECKGNHPQMALIQVSELL